MWSLLRCIAIGREAGMAGYRVQRRQRRGRDDRVPPFSAGSHAFRTLNRHTLGAVTQARTGHGSILWRVLPNTQHTSANRLPAAQNSKHARLYYSRCGIHEGASGHKLATLLRTKTGIDALDALARFIRGRRAFRKQKAQATP